MLVKSKNHHRLITIPADNGTMPENASGWLPKCLASASGDTGKVTFSCTKRRRLDAQHQKSMVKKD